MIATGHQPNYLPYLGFFHKISLSEVFVLVDTVQFVKRGPFGWIHRNRIRTADGTLWLTIPVLTSGKYHQAINETKIDNSRPWRRKHWESIRRAYQSAPYFQPHKKFFENLYRQKWGDLTALNETVIRYLLEQFKLPVKITKTSELKTTGQKADLIIDLCRRLGADTYVHGPHGEDYIDKQKFADNNIKCIWQEFHHPVYPQQYEPFLEGVSAIDLLFNCGPKSRDIILKNQKAG
ncbi:MAG: WbqC family protein [Planctomycetes bacterium]|nr:WbqC family protein [Planctomycetota bacterium]